MRYASSVRVHLLLFSVAAIATAFAGSATTENATDYGTISSAVAQVMEEGHFSGQRLNTRISRIILANYLHDLDEDHLYFTQQDVDAITKAHADTIAKDALMGRTGAAVEIFDLYKKRVNERMEKIESLLKTKLDFTGANSVEVTREHSAWPADDAEADKLWQNQIAGEMLDEKLNGSTDAEGAQTITGRYKQSQAELLDQPQEAEAMAIFLNALVRTYDPHSEYLRKQDIDDLDSDMSLSMVGIGVVIEGDGRYVRIVSVLPGSPAATDGRLKANDRILAIAKEDGDFVDIAGMSIDHVLSLMRSKQGTHIRLKVTARISNDGADAPEHRDIDLISRNIDLVDDEAKAEIVEHTLPDGKKERLGWITLPSFYGDPDHPQGRSVSRDMRTLVTRLKKENVAGMVIDMRNNPGGELEEAVGVGGLFLGAVPIVQEKDRSGKIYVSKADGPAIYDGPLVVLTDHMTASAAELLGAALQDYGRAVMVGGNFSTFGKGS
ncbi:MAG TPA: S41 family peptidase, partial [Chthoniobacteraceae bacterium]|nr:S41 family peptidase [Chthoniobacteraceae bacterium]